MSRELDKARELVQAGRLKQAVNALSEIAYGRDASPDEVRGLLELATALRDRTDGSLRAQCEDEMQRAQMRLDAAAEQASGDRVRELASNLRRDPVRLARWAREAGLTWLEVESTEDVAAAALRQAALTTAGYPGSAPKACLLDLVEAEGWRPESVTHRFVPTTVQTSIFRGADLLGGDVVQGEEAYLYLFRRLDH